LLHTTSIRLHTLAGSRAENEKSGVKGNRIQNCKNTRGKREAFIRKKIKKDPMGAYLGDMETHGSEEGLLLREGISFGMRERPWGNTWEMPLGGGGSAFHGK